MNVTIPDLAPLEDILVEEITEHEHGKCAWDGHDYPVDCTSVAVAIISDCSHESWLICAPLVSQADAWVAAGEPCACNRPPAECWSVVMLP